jgi:ribose/xylose/arabinose/galactoside ABC-type transport system permease subunit
MITSFIVTIGMLSVARGLTNYISEAKPINLRPMVDQFHDLKITRRSPGVVAFLLLIVLGVLLVRRTAFGRLICATGRNPKAARIAGVKTHRVKVTLFVAVGMLAGLSGILSIVRFGSASHAPGRAGICR